MNVIVANDRQVELSKIDIDTIKSISGTFEPQVLVEMFRTFFFNKMVLDVTALKNYESVNSYRTLISGLDAEKIIFYLPENTNLCTSSFLSQLINIGIYNFTTNLEGVKYLIKHSNSFKEVEHILTLANNRPTIETPKEHVDPYTVGLNSNVNVSVGPKIIGIKNLTKQGGATTFTYMLKNELSAVLGRNTVLAIEIDKNDFHVFNDKEMISANRNDVRSIIRKSSNYQVILIDLNEFPDLSICSDIYYLLEPSIIKLNKLIRRDSNIFEKMRGKKLVLNQSLLSEKDITDFEYEAKTDVFYNMPPLDDRKRNEAMKNFLYKAGFITGEIKENSTKVFGLFRR